MSFLAFCFLLMIACRGELGPQSSFEWNIIIFSVNSFSSLIACYILSCFLTLWKYSVDKDGSAVSLEKCTRSQLRLSSLMRSRRGPYSLTPSVHTWRLVSRDQQKVYCWPCGVGQATCSEGGLDIDSSAGLEGDRVTDLCGTTRLVCRCVLRKSWLHVQTVSCDDERLDPAQDQDLSERKRSPGLIIILSLFFFVLLFFSFSFFFFSSSIFSSPDKIHVRGNACPCKWRTSVRM